MNFETRQRCETCHHQNRAKRGSRANCQRGSTCLHGSLSSLLKRLLTPLEY